MLFVGELVAVLLDLNLLLIENYWKLTGSLLLETCCNRAVLQRWPLVHFIDQLFFSARILTLLLILDNTHPHSTLLQVAVLEGEGRRRRKRAADDDQNIRSSLVFCACSDFS